MRRGRTLIVSLTRSRFQTETALVLPLVGVALGWALKTFSDYLVARSEERRTFRRATFYLLRAWKALFDYDRGTTYFRKHRPEIESFERWRAILQSNYMEATQANSQTTSKAIDLLSSVDPTAAMRLHNTLANMALVFRRDLGAIARTDAETYVGMLNTQDALVSMTLSDVKDALLRTAGRSSLLDSILVRFWIAQRVKGTTDFEAGMKQQQVLRDRAVAIPNRTESGGSIDVPGSAEGSPP